jgi:hypothetical protein
VEHLDVLIDRLLERHWLGSAQPVEREPPRALELFDEVVRLGVVLKF